MDSNSINQKSKIENLNNILNNIKSVYFLRKVFDIIVKIKRHEITKYNKKL